jgi:manganese/zinc/iron transport system permease protein
MISFLDYFSDPALRGPTGGTLLMCIGSALMGVILLLQKRTLLGETLSHAAYPGLIFGVALMANFFPSFSEGWMILAQVAGALVSSLLGFAALEWMEKRGRVYSDTALAAVLSFFFGIGVVAMSAMQSFLPSWQTRVQMLLFGQAATMSDLHIWLSFAISLLIGCFVWIAFRPLQALLFDRTYALCVGVKRSLLEKMIFSLLLLALLIGIRSVGVALVAGMAIAPAIAARAFSNRLKTIFWLAASFGAASGLFGNILSVELSIRYGSVPTGPVIILTGTAIALLSLLFAPQRGLVFKRIRIASFRLRRLEENILKGMWKRQEFLGPSSFSVRFALFRLIRNGWIEKREGKLLLTLDGSRKAASIVRLHRLWELYLAKELQYGAAHVHKSAEEMEHILTPEMEERLTQYLAHPTKDPHEQPIPKRHNS